jgi:hypothetical protein
MIPAVWEQWQVQGHLREDPEAYAFTDAARLLLNLRLLEAQEALESMEELNICWP